VSDPAGEFSVPLTSGTEIGSYEVAADCGPVLTAPLDVVLVSEAGGSTSSVVIIVFFLAMGLLIYRRRLLPVSN
jgi:hypothetical protein